MLIQAIYIVLFSYTDETNGTEYFVVRENTLNEAESGGTDEVKKIVNL